MSAAYCDFCHYVFVAPPKVAPPQPPPVIPEWVTAKNRQPPQVLAEPKYLVNTGYEIGCPQCGSFNLIYEGKMGTGLGYFGNLSHVIVASIIDGLVAQLTPGVYRCGFCGSGFVVRD